MKNFPHDHQAVKPSRFPLLTSKFKSAGKFIRDVLTLDVEDFSYLFVPKNLRSTLSSQPNIRKRGLFLRIGTFLWHTVQSLFLLLSYQPLPKRRILFVNASINQRLALAPVVDQMDEGHWVNILQQKPLHIPLFLAYIIALPFFPLIAVNFLRSKGDQKEAFYYVGDYYWFAYGYYTILRLLLRSASPKAVIVSNDHIMWLRAFVRAAQDENIPTIYLQHASVTEQFPPLSFDYAFLEGFDSLEKYAAIGSSQTEVFLTGMPKFDAHFKALKENNQLHTLGICTNLLDSYQEVKSLCDYLKKSFPDLDVVIRPHPRDNRYQSWKDLAKTHSWYFSNGKEESSFDFLQRVDANIAGDSNIHLEAVLLNVFPIYYAFGDNKKDWYGFHRNGLVDYFETPEAVNAKIAELLKHIPPVRSRSQRYNATIGTKYDGHSTDLTCMLIRQIAQDSRIDLSGWELIREVEELQAYSPKKSSNLL